MSAESARIARIEALHAAAAERILVLDGSWGAKIQELRLTEEDFRGDRFVDHSHPLRGDMDMLCLTRPAVITELLYAYLGAGGGYRLDQHLHSDDDRPIRLRHAGDRLGAERRRRQARP